MLARPEIGTKEDMLLWLGSKPADETYPFANSFGCACGQYSRDRLGFSDKWLGDDRFIGLNKLASSQPWTFGALYERARKAWDA